MIDREAVIGFRDHAKPRYLKAALAPVAAAIDRLREQGDGWTLSRAVTEAQVEASAARNPAGFGNELDAIAVDQKGRVLLIEAKDGHDTAGVGWTPAQVAVYLGLTRAWIAADESAAADVLEGMIDQRVRLGLAGSSPPTIRRPPELVPVIARARPRDRHRRSPGQRRDCE